MVVKQVVDVDVINKTKMKNIFLMMTLFFAFIVIAQDNTQQDEYKKRVLETTEIDILSSLYGQDGDNAAVTGGIGSEELVDAAMNIAVAIPLNDDDVLAIDATISAYSSASSSNLNPFSGASSDDEYGGGGGTGPTKGSPWTIASGASQSDIWANANFSYSHSSDDRNTISNAHLSIANEFDYFSFGFGAGLTKLFNQKNTEIGLSATVYLDNWRPAYPTEVEEYVHSGGNLYTGFFDGVDILNQAGNVINKSAPNAWKTTRNTLVDGTARKTHSFSLSFSQIINKRSQFSIFSDVVIQKGWLSNPMQRVYFSDKANFYIGTATDIPRYTSKANTGVFQLADDIERLPDSRVKIPVGIRYHYYINEHFVFKTYYRYYTDDWGLSSHTINVELPIKVGDKFTFYPNFRYYTQTAADYFAPYEQHVSTEKYYTSDYDLSAYSANQFGLGIRYKDIFTKFHIGKFGLKNVTVNYNHYKRDTGLFANIISFGFKFIAD